jgi:ParB family chromosome partitioning protein
MPSTTRRRPSYADFEVAAAAVPAVDDRVVHRVGVSMIRLSGRNPRDELRGLDELADSLQEHGLLQPIVVRRVPGGYELIAGHRRLEAWKRLGKTEITAVVRDETDEQAYILTLVENLQREDLSPREEAGALEVLVRERGWTTRQVGEAIKRSPMYVSRRLRVFDDPVLAPLVLSDQLQVSTAEELLRADPGQRQELAERAAREQWTQGVARRAVRGRRCNVTLQAPSPRLARHIRTLTDELSGVDPETVNVRTRRELARLIKVAQAVAESACSPTTQ